MAYEEIIKATTLTNGAANRFINKVYLNSGDVSLLMIGDSVSDSTTDWFYQFAQWLGTAYPTHSVSYRAWNHTNQNYDSAVSLATGSGSHTIRVWNSSVPASDAYYVVAGRLQTAVIDTAADVVICATGHNHLSTEAERNFNYFLVLTQTVAEVLPDAQIVMSTINPRTDVLAERSIWASDQARRIAGRCGYLLIDPYRAFTETASWQTALVDVGGIHPTTAGHALWRDVAKKPFRPNRKEYAPVAQVPSSFLSTDENLVRNGRFVKWSAGVTSAPDFWTRTGTGGSIAQGTVKEMSPTPARLTTAAATNFSWLRQQLDARDQTKVKGRTVTLSARCFIPNTVTWETSVTAVIDYNASVTQIISPKPYTTSALPGPITNGYFWVVSTGYLPTTVPSDVSVGVYAISAGSTVDVTVDRVSFVVGGMPRDWNESTLDSQYPLSTRVRTETTGTIALTASDATIQRFQTALTGNTTVTLPTTNISTGHTFRIIRSAAGNFTLTVSTIAAPANKVFASATQGWVEVMYNGTGWEQIAQGPWP